MKTKPGRLFLDSAGVLSLIVATALVIGNWTPTYIQQPHDPIFMISVHTLFWIVAGIAFVMALICLFGRHSGLQIGLIAWLTTIWETYWLALFWNGGGNLNGYFANFPDAFGISARWAGIDAEVVLGYLFIGSYFCLIWLWRQEKLDKAVDARKMFCPACGGHIKFAAQEAGQQIACPHCETSIVLQAAGTLKMTCVLCGGHIEFPAHSLGQRILCPHCAKAITLLKPI